MQIKVDEATYEQLAALARPQKAPVGWCAEPGPSCFWPRARVLRRPPAKWACACGMCASGRRAFSPQAWPVYRTRHDPAARRFFPPAVALHVVKLACERPEEKGRSLSQWDAPELARELVADGLVESISAQTVRRILQAHQLKPWRQHLWLSAKTPRDAAFCAQVQALVELYTRPLAAGEMVLCLDEKTSLQPRSRLHPTLPARPGQPVRVEHEYRRAGALNLLAAFDTRTGKVYALTAARKRQGEFIALLEQLERELPAAIQRVHLVCDNVSVHKGKQVQAWLALHPRFALVFTPVHCSWMNQVEQWFSILQRKRLRIADFADKTHLAEQLDRFVAQWNERAHPFRWSSKSVAKVMAKCQAPLATSELQAA